MFRTIQELKDRVRLVLKLKSQNLKKDGYNISPDEIFNNLARDKWVQSTNLHLYIIVDDILKYKNRDE